MIVTEYHPKIRFGAMRAGFPSHTLVLLACLAILAVWHTHAEAAAVPPRQPLHGPGSSDYSHASVVAHEVRGGASGWWVFTPADPVPVTAPVVVFCHGWGALSPKPYRAWIGHIVRRGNIVIYPNYQDSLFTPGRDFLPNAIDGVRDALTDLSAGREGVHPDLQRAAVVGHSAGGLLSAELAAAAASNGLPMFRAVMPVEPGDGSLDGRRKPSIPSTDFSRIPSTSLLVVLVGADDHRAFEKLGLRIYDTATRIPARNRNVLELRSDRHGSPALIANHAAPGAAIDSRPTRPRLLRLHDFEHAGVVDAMDWYGIWKIFDALSEAAFYGRDRDIALGGGPAQLSMGRWSDGVPVKPMRILR